MLQVEKKVYLFKGECVVGYIDETERCEVRFDRRVKKTVAVSENHSQLIEVEPNNLIKILYGVSTSVSDSSDDSKATE